MITNVQVRFWGKFGVTNFKIFYFDMTYFQILDLSIIFDLFRIALPCFWKPNSRLRMQREKIGLVFQRQVEKAGDGWKNLFHGALENQSNLLWTQRFSVSLLRKKKDFRPDRESNPCPQYQHSSALPTELWDRSLETLEFSSDI